MGLHAAFPQRILAQSVGRAACAADTVFIDAHVAIRHRDRVDIRVDEPVVPCHRIGHAVDVIPSACIEPDKVLSQRSANLHQLETLFDLLDEHVHLDRAVRKPEMLFQARQYIAPKRGLFRRLYFGQIQHERRSVLAQAFVVIDDE